MLSTIVKIYTLAMMIPFLGHFDSSEQGYNYFQALSYSTTDGLK